MIDFFSRAALFANGQKQKESDIFKLVTKSYFNAFNYDGMYFGAAANMTFQNMTDPVNCQKSKFGMDSRCQGYFVDSMMLYQFPFVGYFPMLFMYSQNNSPYLSTGFCKKVYAPEYFFQKYISEQEISLIQNPKIFSITCQSVLLQQNMISFQNLGSNSAQRILIEPITQSIVYQTDFQLQSNYQYTLNDTYLNKLEEDQKIFFLQAIKSFFDKNYILEVCSFDKNYIINLNENQPIGQFYFYYQGQEMVATLQFTYVIDKNIKQNENMINQAQFCYLNNLLLITIMSKNQLQSQAIALGQKIENLDLTLRILMQLIIFISILIAISQSVKISKMINNSVEHLTGILRKIKVDEETKNIILFEDGIFSGDFEIDYSQLFLSSDMLLLYKSFQSLFQTLIFTTSNIFDQDESLTLIQLSKQIQYFKEIKNFNALGICFNNIGSIHFNNCRFMEALENFNQAIIYCKYEMCEFKERLDLKENFKNQKLSKTEENQITSSQKNACLNKYCKNIFKILSKCFECFKLKLKSQRDNLFHANIQTQQELISNIFKNRIDTQHQIKNEHNELNLMLYNRKYNFLISLVYYNIQNEKQIWLWDTSQQLVEELNKIVLQNKSLKLKMGILLNIAMLHIQQFLGSQNESKKIIENSESMYKALKTMKNQQILQSNELSNQQQANITTDQKVLETFQNCTNDKTDENYYKNKKIIQIQLDQQTTQQLSSLSPIQKYQSINPLYQLNDQKILQTFENCQNNKIYERQYKSKQIYNLQNNQIQSAEPSSLSPLKNYSIYPQQVNFLMNYQNSPSDDLIIDNSKKNIDFRCQQNDFEAIKFNSQQKNDKKIQNQQNISQKQQRNYQDEEKGNLFNFDSQKDNQIDSQNIFTQEIQNQDDVKRKSVLLDLNTSKSPTLQFCYKNIDINMNNFTPKYVKRLRQTQINMRKKNNTFLIRNRQNSLFNIQSVKKTKKRANNQLDQKKMKFVMKQNLLEQDNQYIISNNKTMNNLLPLQKAEFRKLSNIFIDQLNNSNNFYLSGFGEDYNTYDLPEDSVLSFLMHQKASLFFENKNYYQAAEQITQMFEKCKIATPYQFNRSFKNLLNIFETFNLSHKVIDEFYSNFVQDISFKICVLHIDFETIQNERDVDKTIKLQKFISKEQSDNQNQLQDSECLDKNFSEEEIGYGQKERVVNLCKNILDKIIKKDDDYFGFTSSSITDMFINQYISMISKQYIERNFLDEAFQIYLNQTEEISKYVERAPLNYKRKSKMYYRYMKSNDDILNIPIKEQSNSRIKSIPVIKKDQSRFYKSQTLSNQPLQKYFLLDQQQLGSKTCQDDFFQNIEKNPNENQKRGDNDGIQKQPNNINFQNMSQEKNNVNLKGGLLYEIIKMQRKKEQKDQNQLENNQNFLQYSLDKQLKQAQKISSIECTQTSQHILNNKQMNFEDYVDQNQNSYSQRLEKSSSLYQIQEEIQIKDIKYDPHSNKKRNLQINNNYNETKFTINQNQEFNSTKNINKIFSKSKKKCIQFDLNNSKDNLSSDKPLKHKKGFNQQPKSTKKSFLQLKQIEFLEKEQIKPNFNQIQNKKKQIFYFSIRKALQEVTGQYTGQSILFQLMESKYKSKTSKVMDKHNILMKKQYIDDILYQNKVKQKYCKKLIVMIIEDISVIDHSQPEFKLLHSELKKLNIELSILILNDQLSIKEEKQLFHEEEDLSQISYFYSEQNLLLYLQNKRNSKYHYATPTIIEHF